MCTWAPNTACILHVSDHKRKPFPPTVQEEGFHSLLLTICVLADCEIEFWLRIYLLVYLGNFYGASPGILLEAGYKIKHNKKNTIKVINNKLF